MATAPVVPALVGPPAHGSVHQKQVVQAAWAVNSTVAALILLIIAFMHLLLFSFLYRNYKLAGILVAVAAFYLIVVVVYRVKKVMPAWGKVGLDCLITVGALALFIFSLIVDLDEFTKSPASK